MYRPTCAELTLEGASGVNSHAVWRMTERFVLITYSEQAR